MLTCESKAMWVKRKRDLQATYAFKRLIREMTTSGDLTHRWGVTLAPWQRTTHKTPASPKRNNVSSTPGTFQRVAIQLRRWTPDLISFSDSNLTVPIVIPTVIRAGTSTSPRYKMSVARPSDGWTSLNSLGSWPSCSPTSQEQIRAVLATADFEQLRALALTARVTQPEAGGKATNPDLSCTIEQSSFAYGFNNVVLEVSFSDRVYWIAKIRYMPGNSSQEAEDAVDLLSEIATMRTVKERTSIPVPQVFAFDASPSNQVGYPYILMEYLGGRPLESTIASQVPSESLPKVAKQLAEVLFQLHGLAFTRLGRIWCGENCDEPLQIIPFDDSATSPKTSIEWFYAHRQEENRRALQGHSHDPEWRTACWVLKVAVPHIVIEGRVHGPFPLCHLDLHHGNLLFDDDYNLTGVIDWSNAQTVSLERLVVSPEFITFPGGTEERNEKILTFRSLIREQLRNLEDAECLEDRTTLPSHLVGSKRADVTHRCTYSLPHRALWDGRLVARLIYGDTISWEQLVRVYGHAEIT